jgi:nucleoid-associated protein YgaU
VGAAATLPGRVGSTAARIAAHVTPALLRRLLQAALGVSMFSGPLAGPALAAPVAAPAAAPAPWGHLPELDRPAAGEAPWRPASDPSGSAARDVTGARAGSTAATERVVVQRGDTLWAIAARALGAGVAEAEIARAWPRWYAANRSVVGADPDLIQPGQVLRPPARPG